MEFDEMKKLWESQNGEPLYRINEPALHRRILSQKKQARHTANLSEWLWMVVNGGSGCFLVAMNLLKPSGNISLYLLSAWMFGSALHVLVGRIRRLQGNRRFDRSLRGDLAYALAVARHQVRLSRLGRWSLLPVGMLLLLGVWEGGKSVWMAVGILIFFALTNYAASWEHGVYTARKKELEELQNKLENEALSDGPS